MKEIVIALLLVLVAHLYCVPKSDDIQSLNLVTIVREEAKPEPVIDDKPKHKGTVELQLADWCAPCKKFKQAGIIAELEAKGWKIKYVSDISKKYPSFRIRIDDKTKAWTGYGSKHSFYRMFNKMMKELGYPNGRTNS